MTAQELSRLEEFSAHITEVAKLFDAVAPNDENCNKLFGALDGLQWDLANWCKELRKENAHNQFGYEPR